MSGPAFVVLVVWRRDGKPYAHAGIEDTQAAAVTAAESFATTAGLSEYAIVPVGSVTHLLTSFSTYGKITEGYDESWPTSEEADDHGGPDCADRG